jgi:hypothetical protein
MMLWGMGAIGILVSTSVAAAPQSALDQGEALPLDSANGAYSVSVRNAKGKVGESATIVVTIKAGSGFKANSKYPHKIKKLSASGVDLPSGSVTGSVQGKNVVFSVPVTPTSAGTHNVTGQIRFSVCNDSQCLIKKAPLAASVTAS